MHGALIFDNAARLRLMPYALPTLLLQSRDYLASNVPHDGTLLRRRLAQTSRRRLTLVQQVTAVQSRRSKPSATANTSRSFAFDNLRERYSITGR
jgi:hypothetical protein